MPDEKTSGLGEVDNTLKHASRQPEPPKPGTGLAELDKTLSHNRRYEPLPFPAERKE